MSLVLDLGVAKTGWVRGCQNPVIVGTLQETNISLPGKKGSIIFKSALVDMLVPRRVHYLFIFMEGTLWAFIIHCELVFGQDPMD